MFVRFIGETETWVCFGFCVCLSMPEAKLGEKLRIVECLELLRRLSPIILNTMQNESMTVCNGFNNENEVDITMV